MSLYYRNEIDRDNSLEFVVLGLRDDNLITNIEAWIIPAKGNNLCRLTINNESIIDFDPLVLKNGGYTGCPILYPSPNRVSNCTIKFIDKSYPQIKYGKKINCHGLVHDEVWNYSLPEVSDDCIILDTWIDFEPGSELYKAFPFKHTLKISYCLKKDGVFINYFVINRDNKELPFGFGLHPYFQSSIIEDETYALLRCDALMECAEEMIPTGNTIDLVHSGNDLHSTFKVGTFFLDHDLIKNSKEKTLIYFRTKCLRLTINTSNEFSHLVVYSPLNMDFFCIENQTCSIDAHNLYAKGYKELSGLIIVKPDSQHSGFVQYLFDSSQ